MVPPTDRPTTVPGVIAPPPLIFLGALAAGLLLDAIAGFPGIAIWWPLRWLLGLGAIAGGVRLVLSARRAFRQAGTPVAPWKPTTALVTTGVFARSRNPIYIAMALIQVGLALLFDAIFGIMAVVPALFAIRLGVIDREERYLLAAFGERYRAYADKVRRWI